jgi:hypothetical protein
MLSWAGKEILIKAVAQAIPTFAMGFFDVTKSICNQISTMICRYWWSQREGSHKIHWLCRDKMIRPKSEEDDQAKKRGWIRISGYTCFQPCNARKTGVETPKRPRFIMCTNIES